MSVHLGRVTSMIRSLNQILLSAWQHWQYEAMNYETQLRGVY
jgi:hypothetical protein